MKIGIELEPIEVPIGTIMGGYSGRTKPSQGVHDTLYARSLIIEINQSKKICICVADVVALDQNRTLTLKKRISEALKIPIQGIFISATHTHSGPLTAELFGKTWDRVDILYNALFESAIKANKNLFEGKIEYSVGEIKDVSFNRRDFDENSVPVNYEVVALKLLDLNNNIKGIVYNYSNHCVVMNDKNLLISQDWPYYTSEKLKEKYGSHIKTMFLQGTCGNLNPINVPMTNPDHTWDDVKMIGDKTAEQLIQVLNNSKPLEVNIIKSATNEVELELDDQDKSEFFTFCTYIEKNGIKYVSTYCQALRIGNLIIIGLSGEAFSETGLVIKKFCNQTVKATMVVGYANDYIGYFGPPKAYRAGGYEMTIMSLSENEEPQLIECVKKAFEKIK